MNLLVRGEGFGHAYFSVEKSRDPASRRRAPAFKSLLPSCRRVRHRPIASLRCAVRDLNPRPSLRQRDALPLS